MYWLQWLAASCRVNKRPLLIIVTIDLHLLHTVGLYGPCQNPFVTKVARTWRGESMCLGQGSHLTPLTIGFSVYSKRNAHLIRNFLWPRGGGGPKIQMVDYVNGSSKSTNWMFGPPPPVGGHKKNSELNMCFFWNRLYIDILQLEV